jgi:hypothetical protein
MPVARFLDNIFSKWFEKQCESSGGAARAPPPTKPPRLEVEEEEEKGDWRRKKEEAAPPPPRCGAGFATVEKDNSITHQGYVSINALTPTVSKILPTII